MENRKIDVLFGVVVIAFLLVTVILIKDFNLRRATDFKEYKAAIVNIVTMKNDRIKILANMLAEKEKENLDLKNTLGETRNALDTLSKRLAQNVPGATSPTGTPAVTTASK